MKGQYLLLYLTAFICTFLITVLTERLILPRLSGKAAQPIYTEGPSWHRTKAGTPTMGGIAFIIGIDTVLLLLALMLLKRGDRISGRLLLASVAYATLNGGVGLIDDCRKLKRKENKGLSPIQKLLLQGVLAAAYMLALGFAGAGDTSAIFSFGEVKLGILYYPLALFILLGIVNCANLTDGIDGLASTVAFAIGCVLLLLSHTLFPDVSLIGVALMGGCSGFLVYNLHPARVFMGDTGSLYLGAMVAAAAFSSRNMLLAVIVGIVYVIEGVSVIIQVTVYKITGKRVFKMAPLHHHLEKCGWSENRICVVALVITLLAAIPSILLFV